jgi:glycerophosphoryl diester phosphodiesterase
MSKEIIILAHRGYHVDVPENTEMAFERAWKLGVAGIETDVRLSADGLPVLFHDRITPGGVEVASLTVRELSDAVGHDVPTLGAALKSGQHGIWNLEIKVPAALKPTLSIIDQCPERSCFLITSFWHSAIAQCLRVAEVDCGMLVAHRPADARSFLRELTRHGSRMNTVVWYYEVLDEAVLEEATRARLRNFVYGAITPGEHRRLLGLPIDGVITDHPEYMGQGRL